METLSSSPPGSAGASLLTHTTETAVGDPVVLPAVSACPHLLQPCQTPAICPGPGAWKAGAADTGAAGAPGLAMHWRQGRGQSEAQAGGQAGRPSDMNSTAREEAGIAVCPGSERERGRGRLPALGFWFLSTSGCCPATLRLLPCYPASSGFYWSPGRRRRTAVPLSVHRAARAAALPLGLNGLENPALPNSLSGDSVAFYDQLCLVPAQASPESGVPA